jgi:hypothetical protein
MEIKGEAKLLRIFIGENDRHGTVNLYERIVLLAKESGLAGATVFKGIMSFGGTSRIHTSKILRLSDDMPLIVEIVDEEKKIDDFMPLLNKVFDESNCGGLITMEKAQIIKYKAFRG